jgi:predicted acyltransferase
MIIKANAMKALPRVRSIDAFRAVTMFLMIFVNDIEDIPNTPQWIHHVADDIDGIGLADIIFPAFLFIVGLSIPFSIQNRSGRSKYLPLHIIKRAAVLMFWGFLFTNLETYDTDNTIIQRGTWQYLAIISMFLIFLDYSWLKHPWLKYAMQATGVLLLIFLTIVYRSEDLDQPWLHFTWWGILGLIGWAYLYGALIFYFSEGKLWAQLIAWGVFFLYNLFAHMGFIDSLYPFYPSVWLAGNGAMQAFTMAGIVMAVFYTQIVSANNMRTFWLTTIAVSLLLVAFAVAVRPGTGGLSKASETPAWVAICTSACALCYLVFVFVVDLKKKYNWIKPIEAAGIATLTCFMLPDIFYSWLETTDFDYPEIIKDGMGGIIRGIVFTLIIIWAAALLLRAKIRLKI